MRTAGLRIARCDCYGTADRCTVESVQATSSVRLGGHVCAVLRLQYACVHYVKSCDQRRAPSFNVHGHADRHTPSFPAALVAALLPYPALPPSRRFFPGLSRPRCRPPLTFSIVAVVGASTVRLCGWCWVRIATPVRLHHASTDFWSSQQPLSTSDFVPFVLRRCGVPGKSAPFDLCPL